MVCKYYCDEFCTNDQCPMCADYCPVPDMEGVCKYEERIEDEIYVLTPKGCFIAALHDHLTISEEAMEAIWRDFSDLMYQFGYVKSKEEE